MTLPVAVQAYPPQHPGFPGMVAGDVELRTARVPDAAALIDAGQDAVALITRGPLRYDAALLEALPSLRWICAIGSGVDAIDVAAATRRGIPVSHNPGASPQPVVEYVLAAIVQLLRRLPELGAAITAGAWDVREEVIGRGAADATLGVIGFGHIGAAVARAARAALGMRVLVHSPSTPDQAIAAAGAERAASLADLLRSADAVTLHVPLRADTRGLLGAAELALMGPEAVLINTARGPVVDEDALVSALAAGRLGGAALDVFPVEPARADHPLAAVRNVILTPHIAGLSQQGIGALYAATAEALRCFLRGERPPHLANPEAWETSDRARGGVAAAATGR